MGSDGQQSMHVATRTRCSFHLYACVSHRESTNVDGYWLQNGLLNQKLDRPQGRPRPFGEQRNICPLPEIEPLSLSHTARSMDTTMTELPGSLSANRRVCNFLHPRSKILGFENA
jgi:hypothetical protein